MLVKNYLLLISTVLLGLNLIGMGVDIFSNVWLRLVTSVLFLFAGIKIIGFKKLLGLSIFVLLILCDILLLNWETTFAKYAFYTIHGLIMLFFLVVTIRVFKWPKMTFFETVPAILFLFVNSWILLTLTNYFQTENIFFKILFFINGFLTILLVVFAFFMSVTRPSNSSAYFFIGILSLIVSELILFSIYYIGLEPLRFADNFLYVISLYFLLKASLENRIIKETPSTPVDKEIKKKENSNFESLKTYR